MPKRFIPPRFAAPALALAAAGAVCLQSSAHAEQILTYTGPAFNQFFSSGSPDVAYGTADHVTVTLTLADPLGAAPQGMFVNPLSFSISDGIRTVDNSNVETFGQPGSSPEFFFGTNPDGSIFGWSISVFGRTGDSVMNLGTSFNPFTKQYQDSGDELLCSGPTATSGALGLSCGSTSFIGEAAGFFKATTATTPAGAGWTVQTVAVPEPGTMALMALGLGGLAVLRRRRDRAQTQGAPTA